MKYIKVLGLCIVIVSLVACKHNGSEDLILQVDEWEEEFVRPEPVGTILEPVLDDEIGETLARLGPIPYLTATLDGSVHELTLIDLLSGEVLATYESAEDRITGIIGELENGYFVGWVWNMWEEVEPTFIIFDENLQPIETIFFEGNVLPFGVNRMVRMENGELFAYGWGWSQDWDDWRFDEPQEFLRVNIHTGEFEVLFEAVEPMPLLHKFINNTQILASNLITVEATGEFATQYGIFDLETGEETYFKIDGFAYGDLDFHGSRVLFVERPIGPRTLDGVVLFDTESLESTVVPLLDGDSFFGPRFSYDGNHIVTINEERSVFRKYDLTGEMVVEIEIDLSLPADEPADFEIFPLTNDLYTLHTWNSFGRHIQFIKLP